MKKKRSMFLLLLTIVFCIISIATGEKIIEEIAYALELGPLTIGTPDPLNDELAKMISRYRTNQLSIIGLSTIITFTWDRVHIFLQYASASDLDSIVGASWRNVDSCSYGVGIAANSDGYSLLVFTHKSSVVYCLVYLRSNEADFYVTETDTKLGIPRQDAFFVIDEKGKIRQAKK